MATRLGLRAALAVLALVFASPAHASSTQESILQDDAQLIYASPQHMAQTLEQLSSLGVDRVKLSLVWWLVAPNATSTRRPNFNASDPAAYPPGAWDRYDMLVRMAQELGLKTYFEFSPADPAWAVARGESTKQGPSLGHAPDPKLFEQFVEAAGRRYSGDYDAPVPADQPSPAELGIPGGSLSNSGQPAAIPRVDYWGIWNEPNERSWLNPWWRPFPGHKHAMIQAELYRNLFDAAWSGLAASGHNPSRDTILIGETANAGVLTPAAFTRALYCVGTDSKLLRGAGATAVGCPSSGNRRQFVSRNPGLFKASGYALHPYGFDVAPNRPYPNRSYFTFQNLGSFRRLLQRAFAAYAQHPRGGAQLYLTEWGYKTRPPNPFNRTTLAEQQAWLDEGDYLAWKDGYVRALAQFLLVDDTPKPGARRGSRAYWSTFQTGLEYASGQPKPAFYTFRIPIWLSRSAHGNVSVWGQLRVADHAAAQQATVWYQRGGSSTWTAVQQVQTTSPEGFLTTHLSLPGAGSVRLGWVNPATGGTDYSRGVRVY